MCSIHDMIHRFRNTRPTPREVRRMQQQQGNLQEMWWVRDGEPTEEDKECEVQVTRDSFERGLSSQDGSRVTNMKGRTKSFKTDTHQHHRSVDKVILEDIEQFLKKELHVTDRLWTHGTPRVLSSRRSAPSPGKHIEPSKRIHPPISLIPVPDSRGAVGSATTVAGIDGSSLRRDFALTPQVYTGSAELRREIVPYSSQEETINSDIGNEEGATGVKPFTAAGIVSDLDVVLENLRSGRNQDAQVGSPEEHHASEGNLPVNLGQIAHILDTELLQFTLMARAREKAAREADMAEEDEKIAWKQGETRRIEDMVRLECKTLPDAAQGPQKASEACHLEEELPEDFDVEGTSPSWPLVDLSSEAKANWGYHPMWNVHGLVGSTTLHNNCSSSSLPDSHPWEHADVTEDAAVRQMAHVIRSVEARVKKIQALQVESFCSINSINSQTSQEGGMQDQEHGRENRATAAKSKPVEGDTLPAVRRKEGHADCLVGENVTEGIHADVGVPREALNIDSTRGSSPNVGGNRKVVYPAQQGEITIRPCHSHVAMSQSWLYGRATLEETGRCIGAELEVAMLCMQRRLGQESVNNANPGGSHEDRRTKHVVEVNKDAQGSPKYITSAGNTEADEAFPDQLQTLADDMTRSKEDQDVDRELGLECGDRCFRNIDFSARSRGHDVTASSTPYLPNGVTYETAGGVSRLMFGRVHAESGDSWTPRYHLYQKVSHKLPPKTLPAAWSEPAGAALGDTVRFRRDPSAPEGNLDLNGHDDCLSIGDYASAEVGAPVMHGIRSGLQRSFERSEGGERDKSGFALARARRRLRDIQRARTSESNLSRPNNSLIRGVYASATGTRRVPTAAREQFLGRLRKMRLRYASDAIAQESSERD